MAPLADHRNEMAIRRKRLGRPSLRQSTARDVDVDVRDEAYGRWRTSRWVAGTRTSSRDRLVGRQGEEDAESDDDDEAKDANDADGRDDDGDGRDEDSDSDDGQRPSPSQPQLIPAIPTIPISNPFTSLLPTLFPTSQLTTVSTTSSTTMLIMTTTPIPTTTSTRSTLTALPRPTEVVPPVLNPQVVTVSSVTVMTTTSVIALPVMTPGTTASSRLSSSTTSQSPSATAALESASPTIFINNTGDNDQERNDYHRDHDDGPPPGALSPTAEDALISAGSIGAFILICFTFWMAWRMMKKRERARYGMDGDDYASPRALLAKIPYFGRSQRGWQDMKSADMRDAPPMYESRSKSAAMGPTVSVYSTDSRRQMAKPTPRQGPITLPQLDTTVAFSPAVYSHVNPFSASVSSSSPHGTLQSHSSQSSQNLSTQQGAPYADQQLPAALPRIQTNMSPKSVVNNPFESPEDALVSNDLSPSSAAQYGGEGTMQTFQSAATDRSRLPGYFNQSELARSASNAYDPASRAVNRASELSSISSGFGDGDIIVPPPAAHQHDQDSRPVSYAKSAGGQSRPQSVANRSEAGRSGQRDTVYTATSEDTPARYRSVDSWVNQQTGRVERQQKRDEAQDVPPVPLLPPEQRLTMMMDDGEQPRRYEDTLSSQPPVPALPTQKQVAELESP